MIRALLSVGMIGGSLAILVILALTRPLPGMNDSRAEAQFIAVFQPKMIQLPRQWAGYGSVRALDSADVPARVGAIVVEVAPTSKVGTTVTAGQLLVQLDDQDFRRVLDLSNQQLAAIDAQLSSLQVEEDGLEARAKLAKEDVELVRADEQRVRDAVQSGAAVQREIDRARQMTLVADRAELLLREALNQVVPKRAALYAQNEIQKTIRENAQKNVDRCRITSPIGGILQRFDLELGENVVSGQVVARVVDVGSVEIPIRMPASARGSIRIGDPVVIEVVGQIPRIVRSSVVRIEPEDDPIERTMTLYVEMHQSADSADRLSPGEFVEALVESPDTTARTVIPRRAMRADRVLEFVDGTLRSRPIVVSHSYNGAIESSGVSDVEWIVLKEPLAEGLVLAVDGGRTVAPGARVQPKQSAPKSEASKVGTSSPAEVGAAIR